MLSRRQFLIFGAAAAAAGSVAAHPAEAAIRYRPERSIALHNVHTGESLKTVYWAEGRYQPSVLRQINRLLRDHYANKVHTMDPKVIDLLASLQHRFGGKRPFQVISGYRSPETNAMLAAMSDGVAEHSLHMEGKAVDIRLDGVSVHTLGRAARTLRAGGVGQYPASDFVHVDVGRVRYW
jgi:uncharacterized protein YcbK (DUF882 family)